MYVVHNTTHTSTQYVNLELHLLSSCIQSSGMKKTKENYQDIKSMLQITPKTNIRC